MSDQHEKTLNVADGDENKHEQVKEEGSPTPAKKPNISITRVPSKIGPTAPGFDPSSILHSPNNMT